MSPGWTFELMVGRDGVEPPPLAFSASLSSLLVNNLTGQGGHSFMTTL